MQYQLYKHLADMGDKAWLSVVKGFDADIPITKFYLLKRALEIHRYDKEMLEALLNLLNE